MMTSFTTPASTERLKSARAAGLEPEVLIRAFRLMQTSRRIDDREIRFLWSEHHDMADAESMTAAAKG